MKKLILLLLCLSLVLALAGCSQPEAPAEAQQPSVEAPTESEAPEQPADAEPDQPEAAYPIELFRIGTTASIETAVFGEYNYDMLASGLSELPLVWQDAEGNYHPLLVSYETEDAVTWSYTVEPGMCWSDGEPVTAADILFTLEYDDANGSANFVSQTDADGKVTEAKYAAYVLSDDGLSISLTLASANVRELSNMTSFRVMPKHIYEGKEAVTEAEARVTCGPYMLESFHKEAGTLTFVPNPYYPKTPNAGKVGCQLFGNEDTMYLALQSGDLDMVWTYSAGVSGAYQDVLAADENLTLESVASANAPAVLAFNNANGPFSDENLRLAVSYALTAGRKYPHPERRGNYIWWKDFLRKGKKLNAFLPKNPQKPEEGASILYSGGTTGTTKGILLSNMNFNALGLQTIAASGFAPINGLKMLSVMPVFHGFGLGIGIHTALIGGACCILVPKFNVATYAELLIKKQPNIIPGVPTLFEALLRADKLENADLSCLKGVFCGGDSLSIELKKKVDEFLKAHNASVQIRQGYGLTECVTASCLTPQHYTRVGSIDVILPNK